MNTALEWPERPLCARCGVRMDRAGREDYQALDAPRYIFRCPLCDHTTAVRGDA